MSLVKRLFLFLALRERLVDSKVLESLPYFESLRENATFSRQGNFDVLLDQKNSSLRVCRLIDMNWHSMLYGPNRTTFISDFPLESAAAIALAAEHLNTGNGILVDEVQGLNERCDIRFTTEFLDTAGLENYIVDQLLDVFSRTNNEPCVFTGAFKSEESISSGLLTSLKGYPQMSAVSQATQLDDKTTFPLFSRLLPTNEAYAAPLLEFLVQQLGVSHLAVVHADDSYGTTYLNGFRKAVGTVNITMQTVGYSTDENDFKATVEALKQTGYRYIFVILTIPDQYPFLMEEAYRQGIAGTGKHTWMFTNIISGFFASPFERDSPLGLASVGALQYYSGAAIPGVAKFDEYVESWQELGNDEEDLSFLQSKLPKYPDDPGYNPAFTPFTFELGPVSGTAAKYYDIVIAYGLAACEAGKNNATIDGDAHYQHLLNTTFVGATGTFRLDPNTGSRDPSTALFLLTNFIKAPVEGSDGNFTLQDVLAEYYVNGKWYTKSSIVFNDNSTDIPQDLPDQNLDYQYIGDGLRAAGFTMSSLVLAVSLAFAAWTQTCRNSHVVRASQPIFLHLVCFGAFLMGASIVPLSVDDQYASERGADIACMAFPWLLSIGWCFAFSALFTKTRRVNRIFHNPRFHRVTVTATDVMKPMIALLCINILILSLWTALAPLRWERTVEVYDVYNRPSESFGWCSSDSEKPFWISLVVVNVSVLAVAVQQAFVARKISTEFSESEWIALCMTLILIVMFVGVPVLIIAKDSDPKAYFFVLAAIVFVVCISLLGCIFLPKIMSQHLRSKRPKREPLVSGFALATSKLSSNESTSDRESSQDLGTRILDHPKIREELTLKVQLLTDEIQQLRKSLPHIDGEDLKKVANSEEVVSLEEDVRGIDASCNLGIGE